MLVVSSTKGNTMEGNSQEWAGKASEEKIRDLGPVLFTGINHTGISGSSWLQKGSKICKDLKAGISLAHRRREKKPVWLE